LIEINDRKDRQIQFSVFRSKKAAYCPFDVIGDFDRLQWSAGTGPHLQMHIPGIGAMQKTVIG
jgi:hypothetical protein